MAVGLHAVAKARLETDDAPLVIGCGPVGLAVIAALRLHGARPIVAADFSARELRPSLFRMFWTWRFAVNCEMRRSAAIALLLCPSAISASTSCSRLDSSETWLRAAA